MAQDRDTFRQLAALRLAEAELLLASGQPSGAYYLAGYAIECALKARIALQFRANEIPDLGRVRSIYSHDLDRLRDLSGLKAEHEESMSEKTNKKMRRDWATASKWSEQARYEVWTQDQASDMLKAVGGNDGLLQWVLKRS